MSDRTDRPAFAPGSRAAVELALAVYLEPLASGRRVLWIGETVEAARCVGRSAASVRALLSVPTPASRGRGKVRVASLKPGPLKLRDGSVDLAVVPDLNSVGFTSAERMEELRQVLGDSGVLLAGTPHDGGLGYEPLFELMQDRFSAVRMLGAAPFAGWSVVDFGASGEPAVTVDGSLIEEAPPPSYYLALCAPEAEEVDAYALIQVPAIEAPEQEAVVDEVTEALQQERRHTEELEGALAVHLGELDALRAKLADGGGGGVERVERLERPTMPAPAAGDEGASGAGSEEYAQLEGALHERGCKLMEAQQELERRGALVRDLAEQLQDVREGEGVAASTVPSARADLDSAMVRATEAEAHRAEAEFRVDELRGHLAESQGQSEDGAEVARLEGTVRGLRARFAELEELYGQVRARLDLAEDDRERESTRSAKLERELAETRERVEFEMVRARGASADVAKERGEQVEVLGEELDGARRGFELRISELSDDKAQAVAALDELRVQVAHLRGELAGTQARLRDREAALELQASPPDEDTSPEPDPAQGARITELEEQLARARESLEPLREEVAALAADRSRLEEELGEQSERAAEADGLRARMDELDRGLDAQSEQVAEAEALRQRVEALEGELEAQAARAEEADELLERNEALEQRVEAAEQSGGGRASADAEVFHQLRTVLESLSDTVERDDESVHSELTAVGVEAPETTETAPPPDGAPRGAMQMTILRERLVQVEQELTTHKARSKELALQLEAHGANSGELEREIVDHAQRVRDLEGALTNRAQRVQALEELVEHRESEVTGLEQRLASQPPNAAPRGSVPPAGDEAAVRAELMELQARVGHLSEELLLARRQQSKSVPPAAPADIERLNELLGDRDAELLMARSRLDNRERELRSLRDTATKVREDLEAMLGRVTASGDPSTVESVGSLLRILGNL